MIAIIDEIKTCSKHGIYVDTGSGLCPNCIEKEKEIDELDEKYPLVLDEDEEDEEDDE